MAKLKIVKVLILNHYQFFKQLIFLY